MLKLISKLVLTYSFDCIMIVIDQENVVKRAYCHQWLSVNGRRNKPNLIEKRFLKSD
jgi:hypothetical protein